MIQQLLNTIDTRNKVYIEHFSEQSLFIEHAVQVVKCGVLKNALNLAVFTEDFSIELPIIKVDTENPDTAGFHKTKTFHIRAHVNGNDEDDFFSAHPDKKHVYWTTTYSGNSELFHYEETTNNSFLLKTFWNTYVTFDRKTMSFVQCTKSTPKSNRLYINIPLYESEDENHLSEEDNESCNSEESLIESRTMSEMSDVSEQNSYVSNPTPKFPKHPKKFLNHKR